MARGETMESRLASLERSHIEPRELNAELRELQHLCVKRDLPRAAASCAMFLGDHQRAAMLSKAWPSDLARVAAAQGDHQAAALHFSRAGLEAHAAVQYERAGNDASARGAWERVEGLSELSRDPYTRGLVRFNLSEVCARLGDESAARRARVSSMHSIEAAADGFETQGLRERAFDCYQILIAMGRRGAFENLAEGYLNCIRILREDNLRHYVLQYYEDFQTLALERGELSAAATLFREASLFCRHQRLPYADHYRLRAAETQEASAARIVREGGAATMAENACAAAIDGFNELGAYTRVRGVYERMAALPLGEKRELRYTRLARRLEGIPDSLPRIIAFPEYLKMKTAYPEVWHLDTIEWEQRGSAIEAMGEVMMDESWPGFTRRRALLCRLHATSHDTELDAAARVRLADLLGRTEIYGCLAPLEALFEDERPTVRAAAQRATRHLLFKRSFILVRKGLDDPEPSVQREALEAVSQLHFEHALDPLLRIFRRASAPEVRTAALESLGKIPSLEAAEALVEAVFQGSEAEREQASALLGRAAHPEAKRLITEALADAEGGAKRALEGALSHRRGHG